MSTTTVSTREHLVSSFFHPDLLASKAYAIEACQTQIKLDQNEMPHDWPAAAKQAVVDELLAMNWNRYPEAYVDEIDALLAAYAGVKPEQILTGPGTNYLIALVIQVMARHCAGDIVIAQPSFPLYESQCRGEGLQYKLWPLNQNLEYDLALFPSIRDRSIVFFASPNNPVGNVLTRSDFAALLTLHPSTMFIADEAYFEFADEIYTDFLEQFDNLIIIRTCSKTLAAAGVRLGYIMAQPIYIEQLKKLRLPFLLNHFTVAAARVFLEPTFLNTHVRQQVDATLRERQRVFGKLAILAKKFCFSVKPSQANFFLLRWSDQSSCLSIYQKLQKHSVQVRNISKGPGLTGCLRVSIGTQAENDLFFSALANT